MPPENNGSEPTDKPALYPAMHVRGGETTFNISVAENAQGEKFVLFHVEHSTGATVLPMKAAFARKIAGMLEDAAVKATGLVIAHPDDVPGLG